VQEERNYRGHEFLERRAYYVAISDADCHPSLDYSATIYHGIDLHLLPFRSEPGAYLLFFSRIYPDKGAREAIEIAQTFGVPLIVAGIVQDDVDGHLGHVQPPSHRRIDLLPTRC
jgi:hypothetical protein